jgi:hypothetical protein
VYAPNHDPKPPVAAPPLEVNRVPKSAPQQQHPELKAYLQELVVNNKFNKYCVDCLKNKTAYLIVQYGIFVCEECAFHHYKNFPNQKHYLKEIYTELYDPYQVQVLKYSGNKEFYELLREFKLDKESFKTKYGHQAVKWYKRRFKARCSGSSCFEKKPAAPSK